MNISSQCLLQSYKKAKQLNMNKSFLDMLRKEIEQRNLQKTTSPDT